MGLPKVMDRWIAAPARVDWVLAAAVGTVLSQVPILNGLDRPARLQHYQALLEIAGALLGFYMATLAILLGLLDSRRRGLQFALSGGRAARVQAFFFAAVRATALVLLVGTVLIAVDSQARANAIYLGVWVMTISLAAFRLAKVFTFLQLMIRIATSHSRESNLG